MISDPSFYAAAVPAVILMGLAKGGFSGLGLMALPLMALTVSPVQAAAILLPILVVQDVVTVWAYRRSFDRAALSAMLPGALLGILAGYLLAARVSDAAVALAVGLISVSFAIRRLAVDRGPNRPAAVKGGKIAGAFWGLVSGFTSMVAHAGGPPFQIYMMPQRLPRDVFVGTGAVFFAALNAMKVPPYLALGQLGIENLATSAALFPLAIAATWAGVLLVRRFPAERLYTVIYGLLIVVGGKLMWDGAWDLLAQNW
jgi:uncharacterized membrane protein YfcA